MLCTPSCGEAPRSKVEERGVGQALRVPPSVGVVGTIQSRFGESVCVRYAAGSNEQEGGDRFLRVTQRKG